MARSASGDKALATKETLPCSENFCHACGVCTVLSTTHLLERPKKEVMKRNPFVKRLDQNKTNSDSHPSLFFEKAQPTTASEANNRIRFKFTKLGQLRFIGHLDVQTLLTRAARRAGLSLAYSNGFNPQAKISLAAPLPIFQESEAEIGEMELGETLSSEQFLKRMNEKLPPEFQLTDAYSLPIGKKDSLSSQLSGAIYHATLIPTRSF